MSDNEQTLKDDVVFLRALADGGASGSARDSAVLVAVGLIFSLVAVQYWAIEAGLIPASETVRAWLWLDGLIPFLLALGFISIRFRDRPTGAASRAMTATWSGVGTAFIVADIALYAASRTLGMPLLVKWVFPLILFTLIGGAWGVAFAVRRRVLFGLAAIGAFTGAALTGLVMGRPEEWLVLACGLISIVAAPGGVILRTAAARR